MGDKKVIKQTGENPFAMIDSQISINVGVDGQSLEELKQLNNDVRQDLKNTNKKMGGLKKYLTDIINKGIEKIRGNIGYDFALNMNSLQRGGNLPPPMSAIIFNRNDSLSLVEPHLKQFTWIHIYGELLTGKTHYMHLLSEKLKSDKVYWIKCKALNSEQAVMTIKLALSELSGVSITTDFDWLDKMALRLGKGTVILIDDLPSFQHNDSLFDSLFYIYSIFKKYGIKIISTGSTNINQILLNNFNKEIITFQVPPMSIKEIVDLIEIKNKSYQNANALAQWIGAVTKFNPALVVACVDYIELKEWNITKEVFKNIQEGFYSTELSKEVRDILLNDIEDTGTKELLYRLSIINNDFDDRYVEVISAISPLVTHPFDKLHILEGYWVQTINGRYRVSPFVDKIGISNLPNNIIKEIHSEIAKILQQNRVLTPSEFVKMFSHLVQAEEYDNAAYSLYLALAELNKSNIEEDYWAISSIWYNTPIPNGVKVEWQMLIRAKQIITCLKFGKDINYLVNDLETLVVEESEFIGAIYLLLAVETLDYDLDFSVIYLEKFFSLTDERIISNQFKNNVKQLVWIYPLKLNGEFQIINRLLNIIDRMSKEDLLSSFESDIGYNGAKYLVDNIWISESKLDIHLRNWDRCLDLIKRIKEIGEKKNHNIIYSYAIRAMIIVKYEYENQETEALNLYCSSLSFEHNKDSLFLLHVTMGQQYIFKKRYEEATTYILKALELNSTKFPYEEMDTYIYAAKCFENKEPNKVLMYLRKAIEINESQEFQFDLIKVKLLSEIGVYYFNENILDDSYDSFSEAIRIMRNIQDKNDGWKSLMVVFSHVLGYIATYVTSGSAPGNFENGEPYAKPMLTFFWTDNDKRSEIYSLEKDDSINISMGNFAMATKKYDEALHWLTISEQEYENFNLITKIYYKKTLIPFFILKRELSKAIDNGIEYAILVEVNKNIKSQGPVVPNISDVQTLLKDSDKFNKVVEFSVVYVFLPIMFYISELAVKDREGTRDMAFNLVDSIQVNRQKYGDCAVFDTLHEVFTMTFLEQHDALELLNAANNQPEVIKLMFYLAASLVSNEKLGLEVHLKIVVYLHKVYEDEEFFFSDIIIPFFKTYWLYSYINNRFDFQETNKIDIELDALLKTNNKYTLKRLLSLMNSGLKLSVQESILEFLNS